GESATVEILYEISDGNGGSSTALAVVTVTGSNDGPVAVADSFATDRGQSISGNLLVDNGSGPDSDVDGDPLEVTAGSFVTAQGGTVEIQSDGSFVYTPSAFFAGEDSFEYTLSDGYGGTDTGNATITVAALEGDTAGTDGADLMVFGNGTQVLLGLAGDDTISSGNAEDTLAGGGGNDILSGGNGDDLMFGDSGNDILTGGRGEDTLSGGSGADQFVFGKSGGFDVVTDFELGVDQLVVEASLKADGFGDLKMSQQDDGVVINMGGAQVLLLNVTIEDLGADDFLFL
ncbi:Ig-like domain-containing protein, partial [Pseudophaeobacter sp. 1A16562]|uniref:Ig-like domain-containing protein n=1 Tax=Pseudophaeobacter sp. 1A16562 TaxID=3098143 RepID=UPI0034D7523F